MKPAPNRLLACILPLILLGCGISNHSEEPAASDTSRIQPAKAADPSSSSVSGTSIVPQTTGFEYYFGGRDDQQRLQVLWSSRTSANPFTDFGLGPGDEITLSIPGFQGLEDDLVRVSSAGTIYLPLIGQISVAGMTEDELRNALKEKLERYMYDPEFKLTVKQYRTRFVAVLGAVKNPGVYPLTGYTETIMSLLSLAGGPTDDAADRLMLIPAVSSLNAPDPRVVSTAERLSGETHSTSTVAVKEPGPLDLPNLFLGSNGPPLIISMKRGSLAGSERYLNLPLRPGDVVIVPSGGEVAVVGWVQNPGHFKVRQGLTVRAAIGDAGGLMYAANKSRIRVLRSTESGISQAIDVNWDKIESGQEVDPIVQGNATIEVTYSEAKILPYIVYSILNTKVGVALPTW